MASPKSGKGGSAVKPEEADVAADAANAKSGAKSEGGSSASGGGKGKGGSSKTKPYKPPKTDEEKKQKTAWIEIELVDSNNKPVAGEPCRVVFADNTEWKGTLDHKGFVRLEQIEPGNCEVSFPKRDQKVWKKV